MRSVLAYPGTMAHAQQIALALHEHGALRAYVTMAHLGFTGRVANLLMRSLPAPTADGLWRQVERRRVSAVPSHLVHSYPAWELVRTAVEKAGGGPVLTDIAWDIASHRFDDLVAQRYVPRAEAVHAFEYVALRSFEMARERGVARILHLPAFDNRHFDAIRRRELTAWPELSSPSDRYFERRFERRQQRRLREIALADVIVCNSRLTAASHIAAGARAEKILVVPLGAPPAVVEVKGDARRERQPLRAIYAGPFSIRKGAHYLLDAWRRLDAGGNARLDVFGSVQLPKRLLTHRSDDVALHGSVPQSVLFDAFDKADVLVFPSLCDGFGMVVSEALARGLPVITTDQVGAAELITPDNGIVVPAADAGALAEALRWCLDNRRRLREMRQHALATARGRQWSDFRRELMTGLDLAFDQTSSLPNVVSTDRVGAPASGQ